mgnify:CR=1 FL=1
MQPKFKKMLYGGDYNPNQWPKEIWDEDMKLFHQAGINSTTINVFSWAKIQPSENEYDFTELDEIVDTLTKEDVQIVMATSTGALPGYQCQIPSRSIDCRDGSQRKRQIFAGRRYPVSGSIS